MPFDNSLRGHQGFITAGLLLDTVYYVRTVSSLLLLYSGAFISFLAGLGQKSSVPTVDVAPSKRPIN